MDCHSRQHRADLQYRPRSSNVPPSSVAQPYRSRRGEPARSTNSRPNQRRNVRECLGLLNLLQPQLTVSSRYLATEGPTTRHPDMDASTSSSTHMLIAAATATTDPSALELHLSTAVVVAVTCIILAFVVISMLLFCCMMDRHSQRASGRDMELNIDASDSGTQAHSEGGRGPSGRRAGGV